MIIAHGVDRVLRKERRQIPGFIQVKGIDRLLAFNRVDGLVRFVRACSDRGVHDLAALRVHTQVTAVLVVRVEPVGDGGRGLVEDIALVRLADAADAHRVAHISGLGADQMLAQQRDAETEHGLAALRSYRSAVHKQTYFTLVGIDLDLGALLAAVFIALAAEMDEGLGLVPGGFIEIKGVLAQAAVKGHKTLLVLAVLAALVPAVGRKVEEVPHMRCPEIRPRLDHGEHVLVIERLILLGVIATLRVGGMEGGVCVRAILGEADHPVGVFGVVLVEELIRLLQLPEIPAEVEVIAVDVGDFEDRALDLEHKDVRHRGQARRVHAVTELV